MLTVIAQILQIHLGHISFHICYGSMDEKNSILLYYINCDTIGKTKSLQSYIMLHRRKVKRICRPNKVFSIVIASTELFVVVAKKSLSGRQITQIGYRLKIMP